MSPFPAAMASARSELGAGSVFFAAVKPPCKIGKTSTFVMKTFLSKLKATELVRKIADIVGFIGNLMNESGSRTRKPCTPDRIWSQLSCHYRHNQLQRACL